MCTYQLRTASKENRQMTAKLTISDLENAKDSPAREGSVGFSDGDHRPLRLQARAARIVLREANRQGWTYADLVCWIDSKLGRWFWDELYGCDNTDAAARYVTLSGLTPAEYADAVR
jgi:hypothetical protein